MGTNEADLGTLLKAAGVALTPDQIDSSRATALTIVESVRQVMTTMGVPLRDARIALEGLGKVGGYVASMLSADGVRLVAVSTADGALYCDAGLDVARLLALRAAHGSRLVEHYDGAGAKRTTHRMLFGTECDVLLPGVRSGVIDTEVEPSIRARALVPFSNAGVQPEAERRLTARGVIVFPDFVANCGGIVAVDLRAAGFSRLDDMDFVVRTVYRDAVARALAIARRKGESIADVCRGVEAQNRRALDNATQAAQGFAAAVAAGPAAVARRLAWRLHKRGALPEPFRHQALHRFLEWRLDVTRGRMIGSTSTSE
jgi:glutamate dehydrogenase/leucine dehydrogenase